MTGPDGATGAQGATGPDGETGPQGPTGADNATSDFYDMKVTTSSPNFVIGDDGILRAYWMRIGNIARITGQIFVDSPTNTNNIRSFNLTATLPMGWTLVGGKTNNVQASSAVDVAQSVIPSARILATVSISDSLLGATTVRWEMAGNYEFDPSQSSQFRIFFLITVELQ